MATENGLSEALTVRCKEVINDDEVMVIVKGQVLRPQCKFSRGLVLFLLENGIVRFGSFNILSDPELREGLKKYSNWSSYPQLYVKGEFVGGLDVVKDLHAEGNFLSMLPSGCFGKCKSETIMDIILQETGVVLICDERQTKDKESATSQTVATLQRLGSRVSIVDLQGKTELQDEYMNRFIADGAISEFVLGLFVDCKLVLNDAQLIEACKANNLTEVLKNQLSARQNERQ